MNIPTSQGYTDFTTWSAIQIKKVDEVRNFLSRSDLLAMSHELARACDAAGIQRMSLSDANEQELVLIRQEVINKGLDNTVTLKEILPGF